MDKLYLVLVVCLLVESAQMLSLPGPLVYVVTPRTIKEQARSSPFYYHNWMRRMDSANDTTTTTTTQRVKTPDLIFAEFEAGNEMEKSLKKLLQKERIETTSTTTTSKPIYVPEESVPEASEVGVQTYGQPTKQESNKLEESPSDDMEDYFAQYNNLYNAQAPIYLPSTTTRKPTTASTITTTTPAPMNVENIWHVIDNEKYDQFSGKWEEVPINDDSNKNVDNNMQKNKEENGQIEENFALPGFSTNPGKGAENESRAIRTEQNYRFPYVNLKTFQMKNPSPPNSLSTSKKGNNMFYNVDNFQDVKNPVRGEAQEAVTRQDPIDRYNPAQPYLPVYGTKSKQSGSEQPKATKTVASLIPPPPPPQTSDSLLPPPTYDSFPPYASQQSLDSQPPAGPPVASKPSSAFQPPLNADTYDSPPADDGDDDGPPAMDLGYRYKPLSIPNFVPTLPPPPAKPFPGYSYDKPPMDMDDSPPDSQTFKGYSYDKPPADNSPPPMADKPSYGGYHDDHPPSYGHAPPSYPPHDSDYPELIFNKPHGGKGPMKGGDDLKANDMGMMPPPPPDSGDSPGPPSHDGFPQDFPGDFKYHDFEHDHDHYHYHHPTTTTTTTTETPRVNRYSYYYLGKKLYYLPLYFSVYFIVYVGALIIKAVLRHKIVYPNSWRPNDTTSTFFTKRSADWDVSREDLHELTGRVTRAIATAAEKYMLNKD